MSLPRRQIPGSGAVERWLEAERDQLALWAPVMAGLGVALWFVLPDPPGWAGVMLGAGGVAAVALAMAGGGRLARAIGMAGLMIALGLGWIWWRAERVAAPVLVRPVVAAFTARVERVEPLPARELVRLTLRVAHGGDLPPRVRVNVAERDAPADLGGAKVVRLRARLMPPPDPAVPGAYDAARAAWFNGIGAMGRSLGPVVVEESDPAAGRVRARLSAHIISRLPGSAGGIAAALATGDVGAIAEPDAEAMRRAGLAHLLSVSGLHITAAVGIAMVVTMRLLALWPWAALRIRLPVVAGLVGAGAAIGYTWLTGAEVPTIRSCVAALLVLAALAIGREAMTLRLVAAGAVVVLAGWPESLAGASFQLSFAAITALVALHEHPAVRAWSLPRETRGGRMVQGAAMLLLSGLVVEAALLPIAAYHFHKAGLYGALANIVAIPWTTFVVMPLEAGALLLDTVGLGTALWWLVGQALALLLALAHLVAGWPGAVAAVPVMPDGAFALIFGGGLWLALWRTRVRRGGLVPIAIGLGWALLTPAPDVIVTGDGRHVAVRTAAGLALLRDRTGDYVSDVMAGAGGVDGVPLMLSEQPNARCSRDLCLVDVAGRRVLATRSAYRVPWAELVAACRAGDIVVSERALPRGCRSRWLRLDRATLRETGGVAVTLGNGSVRTVRRPGDRHPWRMAGR
ncbi:ComEC family competence protein [Sphingomonas sp. NY01]|uniref:ComEC/Rec2 family competence protein n=1 Tax=Sphingomonas sp. NY01 TaxID=2968057 RepID=UPI00315C7063